MRCPETGWSSLGAVVGATYPEAQRRLRELLPRALFLVPGYGAQGGGAKQAVAGFVAGPAGRLEGGLVNSSRGILFPSGSDTDDAASWERAVDEALDRAIGELGEAVSA
jgi:orotidine-5'-phosphate decarboxylase